MTDSHKSLAHGMSTHDIVLVSQFAVLITICSWISIPAAVPFTMQTFAVFLTVGVLGGKRGALAVTVYLILGAIGLPVFSGFAGGLGWLLGPTGGYIIGFLFAAIVMWGMEKLTGRSMIALAAAMAVGLIVCYLFGTVWFMHVYADSGNKTDFFHVLGMCVLPFIIPDCIKIVLACMLTRRLRPMISEY